MADTSAAESAVSKTTVSVTIDGRAHEAQPGQLVIDACQDSGSYVPHFCYHPRMTPVGMCRQCLVEVDGPRGKMMVVSCMTPVAEGQVVTTTSDTVKRAQEGVLELLLANHPLDCPVCDKGGECPLQDQAFSHGPGESRFVEEKRHYEKPIPISELVYLDRERCILCDRCTRFADEVAGDPLISFTSRGNNTQVMTFPDEPFSSYFSGNTVQICPVGALTATPYRFKARPWDLDQVESTCTTCSVGCRVVVQSSRDELVRYQGVDVDSVNWGWLCDRGRFNFESLRSDDRITTPLVREGDALVETNWATALERAGRLVRTTLSDPAKGPAAIGIIGGARGTNEDAFLWARFADALKIDNRDAQLGDGLPNEVFALPQATISEAAASATIILLAPDVKEEAPVLYLRLRDAAQKRRTRIIEVTTRSTGLTPYAWRSVVCEPGDQSRAVRDVMNDPQVRDQLARGACTVVLGRTNLAESPEFVLHGVAEVFAAAPAAKVLPVVRRGNVRGAVVAGLAPRNGGLDTLGMLEAAAAGRIDCLVLLGADPLVDVPDADLARRAFARVAGVIAVDTHRTESVQRADVVLAAAAFGEKVGTTTNLEGRVSDVAQKVTTRGMSRADWMIAAELAAQVGVDLAVTTYADVRKAMLTDVAAFAPATDASAVRHEGVVVHHPNSVAMTGASRTPAQRLGFQHRLVVSRVMYDGATGTSRSGSLVPLVGESRAHLHPADVANVGVTTEGRVRLTSSRASIALPVVADVSVPRGTVWVPLHQHGPDVRELIDHTADVVDVTIEVVR
ncbi:MAG: NADH-quinone oxidoreductase subunit NuoG [Ilumatobacteraceae bacterium]